MPTTEDASITGEVLSCDAGVNPWVAGQRPRATVRTNPTKKPVGIELGGGLQDLGTDGSHDRPA